MASTEEKYTFEIEIFSASYLARRIRQVMKCSMDVEALILFSTNVCTIQPQS